MVQPGWGILNSWKCNNNICDICAAQDREQKSWEQAVISCDQTTDSEVMVTNRSKRGPSATLSFKYKRLAGAGGEARIMSFVMDYYYLERLLPLFYLSWLARINKSRFLPPTLLLIWLKLWKDGDVCSRSVDAWAGHRRWDYTEVTARCGHRWGCDCATGRSRRAETHQRSSSLVDHLVLTTPREPVCIHWRAELCPRTHPRLCC